MSNAVSLLKKNIKCVIIRADKEVEPMEQKLKKNDRVLVKIERLGANGEGVAIHNGVVIFVPFALVGDEVLVHIINDKNKFLIGKIVEIKKSSPKRIQPMCPYFSKCGGCDLQHISYADQLLFKKQLIIDTLKKYAGIETRVEDVVPSSKVFRYRNKFAFPVQEVNGEVKIGMFRKNSHQIIEIDDCMLQSERTQIIIKLFKEFMIENNISAYNEATKTGTVKHIVVREAEEDFIMTVVVTDEKFNKFTPLVEKLKKHFSSFGLFKNINKLNNNVIFGNVDKKVYGIYELSKNEFGVQYFVNNRSFMQVNDEIKNIIYQRILNTLGTQKNVIDAYSGAGLLSSIIAKNGSKVYGVEIIKEATENANKLKVLNNLYNLTNKNGDCAKIIPELAKELQGDFAVVVDPPRKGLENEVVEAFLKAEPKMIVYLSCGPSTLARDLKKLTEKYDISFVQPYDMFPQTANVETLVCLRLKK